MFLKKRKLLPFFGHFISGVPLFTLIHDLKNNEDKITSCTFSKVTCFFFYLYGLFLKKIESVFFIGQDMEPGREGGMWLGVSIKEQKSGRGKKFCFAAILNLTGDHSQNVSGRGKIVQDFLKTNQDFSEYAEALEQDKFSGYNFVTAELRYDIKSKQRTIYTSIF